MRTQFDHGSISPHLISFDSLRLADFVDAKDEESDALRTGGRGVNLFEGHFENLPFLADEVPFSFLPQSGGALENIGKLLAGVPVLWQACVWGDGDMADYHRGARDAFKMGGHQVLEFEARLATFAGGWRILPRRGGAGDESEAETES